MVCRTATKQDNAALAAVMAQPLPLLLRNAGRARVMRPDRGCAPKAAEVVEELPAAVTTANASTAAAPVVTAELVALCSGHVAMNAAAPIMLHWVKEQHGGKYPFSVPALTFHAYSAALCLGLGWVGTRGTHGVAQFFRLGMLARFCLLAVLFAGSDIVNVMSLQSLDPGTFSLVGKALTIVFTVALSHVLIGRRQTQVQNGLVGAIILFTLAFCQAEASANMQLAGHVADRGVKSSARWTVGLLQRMSAVFVTSLASVLQERFLSTEVEVHFLLQQCWMGCGALATTFTTWRCIHGLPMSRLLDGFDDWRVLLVLGIYTCNGLMSGLMVKRVGAAAKALCVPIHLGCCYLYAVYSGTASMQMEAIAAWLTSTALVVALGLLKAGAGRPSWSK